VFESDGTTFVLYGHPAYPAGQCSETWWRHGFRRTPDRAGVPDQPSRPRQARPAGPRSRQRAAGFPTGAPASCSPRPQAGPPCINCAARGWFARR